MPAFDILGKGTVKLVTMFPDNALVGRPTIHGVIIVFSETGVPVAVLDGATVTQLRTAAASALASRYLSRPDSKHLVVVGTGALAPVMAAAHCVVRPISHITVWGRQSGRAQNAAKAIRSLVNCDVAVRVAESLDAQVATADIVSCATSSNDPVLRGRCLRPGTLVDLVGSFSPTTREADDEVMARAQRIFVDTFVGSMTEAGDLLQPLERGVFPRERIEGELADLVAGRSGGRRGDEEIIVFKSVGTAIEDWAASQFIVRAAMESN